MKSPNFSLVLAGLLAFGLQQIQGADFPAATSGLGTHFKGPVGVQLYSLRADFSKDVEGTLKRVREFGITNVELAGTYNLAPEAFKALLKKYELNPVAGHFPYDRLKKDPEGVAKDASALGLKYVGCAWITHKDSFDEAECRDAIEVFNKAGEVLSKSGIKFFYHTHGYEFHPHGSGTLFDLLMKETKPEYVAYEMDVFWIVLPGQDPVKLLKKYGNRWELMHVKDMKLGVKTGDLTGKSDVNNDVTVGTGQMDWPAIMKAAKEVGVKHYFLEDESSASVQQIPNSLGYLKNLKW